MGIIFKYKRQMKVFALIGVAMAQSSGWSTYDDPVGVDAGGDGCDWYYGNEDQCGAWDTDTFVATWSCVACGGGWSAGCTDSNWDTDIGGDGCDWYEGNVEVCGNWDTDNFSAWDQCCGCFGGDWELGCDDTNWDVDAGGDGCDWYNQDTYDQCGQWDTDTFTASEDCCWCEGGEWW